MRPNVSYEGTIKTLIHTQRGAYSNLDYLPVFRASGLFYALADETRNTIVSFLNYWREKNANSAIGALITLRNSDGTMVARHFFNVTATSYQIDLRELLEGLEGMPRRFEGTIELELHSDKDLKFAFPALMVFYVSSHGVSSVHTNQRVFNNAEDQRRNVPFNRWQTGFDVDCRHGASSFVFVANGPQEVADARGQLRIFNAQGATLDKPIVLGTLPPFAARRLDISRIEGVSEFLNDEVGFAKLDLPIDDVYCRFACGIEQADGFIGITHSYFDCTEHSDYYELSKFSPEIFPCFVPVNLVEGVDVDLIFYPIQSKATLTFALQCFDPQGAQRAWIELDEELDTDGNRQVRLDLRRTLAAAGQPAVEGMYCLHIDAKQGQLPARIAFGLNYRIGEMPGTNISSSVLVASSHGAKSRSWLWGSVPCMPDARNLIMISHMSREKSARSPAEYVLTLHNREGEVARHSGVLANGAGVNLAAEDILATAGYRPQNQEILWYVVQSSNPSLISNQIHISRDGRVGGDHSF